MLSNARRQLPILVLIALVLLLRPALAGDESVETLLAYLKSPNAATRRDAAHRLGERRVRYQLVAEALAAAARKDEDPQVRAQAIESLGKIKEFAVLADMLKVLANDPSDEVRLSAVKALVMLYTEHDIDFITNRREGWNWLNPFLDTSDHEIIEPYILVEPSIIHSIGEAARSDQERSVRIAAIRALGVLRGRDAIPQLADALNADREVRIDVLRTFIKIGDQTAGPHLVRFFKDSDQKVRTQAMVAAGLLKYRPAVEPLLSIYQLGPERKSTLEKVARKIKGRFEYLPPRDEAALWALALIGDERGEKVFVENMNSKDADRRQYAFEGLARIADPKYSDQISRLVLSETNDDVKLAQYWALYKMGNRAYLEQVVRKLDSDKRKQAFDYLLEANNPADLYPYINSSNKAVRLEVIEVLGRIGDMTTVRELRPVVQASGAKTADVATLAIKRIEWRMSGLPRADDDVLRRQTRSRRVGP
jgi:HEAT repeat protein